MSENKYDPIRELQNFGTGGLGVDPLEPAAVRRLGDKRRTQRRAAIAIAASALTVVGGIVPVTLAMTAGDSGPSPAPPASTPTPTPTPSPTGLGLGNIPASFPLDLDAVDYSGDGGSMAGPDASVATIPSVLCDTDPIAGADALGRMGFSSTGPEVRDDRELRTFGKVAEATDVLATLQQRLDTCTSWDGGTVPLKVIVLTADTGHESVTFAVIEDPPVGAGYAVGGTVYQITRVGSALLTLGHHGEVSSGTAPATAASLSETTRRLAPEMCLFTPTGCNQATPIPARTVTYPGDLGLSGARIYTSADLPRLRGTSDDFRAYVLEVLRTMKGEADCPDTNAEDPSDRRPLVVVNRYSTAGYAVGSTGGCDGHAAIWTQVDGTWGEAVATQEDWSCAALDDTGIPVSFVGGCRDEQGGYVVGGDFGPGSVDGIELGMTATQVESVGASVVRGPSRCDFLFQAWTEPPLAGTDIADTDGFVVDGKVVAIRGFGSHRTPEGIGNGSARTEVESAYPSGRYEAHPAVGGYWVVPLADGNQYRFYMSPQTGARSDSVVLMEFSRPGSGCGF